MDQFLGRYRGYRIFSIEVLGEFRVEGLTERFLSFTKAQLAIDGVLAELEAPAPAQVRAPVSDEVSAVTWWSNLTEEERETWLQRAGSDFPLDAWAEFKARSQ